MNKLYNMCSEDTLQYISTCIRRVCIPTYKCKFRRNKNTSSGKIDNLLVINMSFKPIDTKYIYMYTV